MECQRSVLGNAPLVRDPSSLPGRAPGGISQPSWSVGPRTQGVYTPEHQQGLGLARSGAACPGLGLAWHLGHQHHSWPSPQGTGSEQHLCGSVGRGA